MMPSRGMGAIKPSKMPEGVKKPRRDNTDFTEYKKGGAVAKKDFIKDAIKKPGALREELGVKSGKNIPEKTLEKAAKAPGKLGQRARFAETLKKLRSK